MPKQPAREPIPGTFTPGFVVPPLLQDGEGTRQFRAMVKQMTGHDSSAQVWMLGECKVIVALEPAGAKGEMLWHLTISHQDRHPTWDEIKTARYRLLPRSLCFGMLLPPPEQYVNVPAQDHVFHLYEVTDPRAPWDQRYIIGPSERR